METKLIEIRDRATFIAAVAMRVAPANDQQRYLLRRSGYSDTWDDVILMPLDCTNVNYDPYKWTGARTLHHAHLWIREHFDTLKDGDVVDVQFILGETGSPKQSERVDFPL